MCVCVCVYVYIYIYTKICVRAIIWCLIIRHYNLYGMKYIKMVNTAL